MSIQFRIRLIIIYWVYQDNLFYAWRILANTNNGWTEVKLAWGGYGINKPSPSQRKKEQIKWIAFLFSKTLPSLKITVLVNFFSSVVLTFFLGFQTIFNLTTCHLQRVGLLGLLGRRRKPDIIKALKLCKFKTINISSYRNIISTFL